MSDLRSTRLWGVLTRKERWGLSWRGWLITLVVLLSAVWGVKSSVHPFLAVTQRVDAKVLVVEGWIHEYAVRAGAEEFKIGSYERVFATGGPVAGNGGYTSDYMTSANVGADLLRKAGIPADRVQMVPCRVSERDRTYNAAVALRNWCQENKVDVGSLNIVTEGAHARRTRLMFQRAFGNDVKVGVIAVADPDYDARYWWRSSSGVREVIGETVAYIYARLFFSAHNANQ